MQNMRHKWMLKVQRPEYKFLPNPWLTIQEVKEWYMESLAAEPHVAQVRAQLKASIS